MSEANGRIISTNLGHTERGTSFWIGLRFGNSGVQAFGGWPLNENTTNKIVRGVLRAAHVDYWESLVDRYVRARIVDGRIRAIGDIGNDPLCTTADWWFEPDVAFAAGHPVP